MRSLPTNWPGRTGSSPSPREPFCIFLLGPNEWCDGPAIPSPAFSKHPPTPLEVRLHIQKELPGWSNKLLQGIVMTPKRQKHGEDDAAFFMRLEEEHHVAAYYFIQPPGCKLAGTTFEMGMLRRDQLRGIPHRVVYFIHRDEFDGEENDWRFVDNGQRTAYQASFGKHGADVHFWQTWNGLVETVRRHSLSLLDPW